MYSLGQDIYKKNSKIPLGTTGAILESAHILYIGERNEKAMLDFCHAIHKDVIDSIIDLGGN